MMNTRIIRRRTRWLSIISLAIAMTLLTSVWSYADGPPPPPDEFELAEAADMLLPDRAALNYLVENGWDLAENVTETEGGIVVTVIATPSEFAFLQDMGFVRLGTAFDQAAWETLPAVRAAALAAEPETTEATDSITILRTDYWQNPSGDYLSVEAKSSAGRDATLTVTWEPRLPTTPSGGSWDLRPFVDAGVYLYHRGTAEVGGEPGRVVVTSSGGGSASVEASEWLPDLHPGRTYQTGFVDHYMDPTELYARIEALAAEFPDLAEIVDLPYLTNGYRRQAMGLLDGSSSSSRVVITSQAWGHEGGNGLVVETVDPGAADQPLDVSVSDGTVSIKLATDASGAVTSTAADIIAAVNADSNASALVRADPYRENSGSGLVSPQSTTLSDYLNAPPEISREPWQVRALRIGLHRDGSRLGVLVYAQEHAREWQTPLVTIETAERLLRNYATGGPSRQLIEDLDIFIIPSVNPDGANYSFYDYAYQRKNMVNYCLGGPRNDPNSRNRWGVDVNRNYDIGSLYDGYSGASTSCSSTTYAGPKELSEPESRNVVWLADTFDNIEFSMNIHSSGNYFMWAPGAYVVPGRISLERPTLGEEDYFWEASGRILQAIKAQRGTVVAPGRTGPVVDVLYSAAGNSGDRLWYANGINAWDFEVGVSFQPDWDEAYQEAMEFSNGVIELFEVARDFQADKYRPRAWLEDPEGQPVWNKKFDGEAVLHFNTTKPATIYYTVDGSRPTFDSTTYDAADIREPGEILTFTKSTTVRWFAVDDAGNISGHYDPSDPKNTDYDSAKIAIK
jgi:hypothetical protein